MIKIDFSMAVALFLIFDMALVMVLWVIYNYKESKEVDIQSAKNFRQCPYCCIIFFDYQKQPLRTCPQCKSLIENSIRQGES
jgi:hypothetical protein